MCLITMNSFALTPFVFLLSASNIFYLKSKHNKESKFRRKEMCKSLSALHCHSKCNVIFPASTRTASFLLLTVWLLFFLMGEKQELFPVLRSHFLNLIHWLVPDFSNWTFFFSSHAWMYILILLLNLIKKKKKLTRPCQHIFMSKTPESLIGTLGSLWVYMQLWWELLCKWMYFKPVFVRILYYYIFPILLIYV